ncbi:MULTISPECIES: hypothetical protein [unclassified Methylobacterium]|uniref:hypothetical protein n=1 Tax=unclassified Methylobacterium TaxID=2615210 RepID=UPI0011C1F3F5|nr:MULTISPECIES: hypothetical protein [unclassified Methylobacterium]QEE41300.1 hypothetical protein FVA80_22390 [Methylobacterium sp. WL1]TXN57730.1 hypothetical protein FV241_09700 [Methylobacterium sp. WL2]
MTFSPGPIEPIRLEQNAMSMKTLALAAALSVAMAGAALAQTPAGGGSAEGNMNNPGSVKSPSQKQMGGQTGMMGRRHMTRHRRHHMRRSRM